MHVFYCGWSFWVEQRAGDGCSAEMPGVNRLTVDVSVWYISRVDIFHAIEKDEGRWPRARTERQASGREGVSI